MKKSIAITLVFAMILVLLAGCGATPAAPAAPAAEAPAAPAAEAPAAPAAEAPAAPAAEAPAAEANGEENWWDDINFDEEVHLIFATTGTAENGPSLGNSRAIEAIKERSNGKIIIERMAGGVLGNENSTFAQCMEGSIDMVGCGSGTVSPYTPLLDVFVLPFLIGSYEQEWAVMQSDEWQAIRQRFNEEFEGVSLLAMFDYGMRHFATIDKPVKTIDDLKGLKIRSQGNPVIDKALQLAGANPVAVSFADLYSALQNGVIDAEEVNSTTVYQQKHYEVVNYISEIGFYPYLSMCVISDKTLERLPEGYADLIFKTFAESERWYMEEYVNEWDAIGRQGCLDGGIEYNTIEDKPVWVERMQVLYDEKAAEDPMYAAFIEKALSLRKEQ